MLAFVVPSDSVEITGNWDVMGLRGTGSFDYSIPEQIVEDGRTFWLFDGEPRCGGGVYRLGVVGFAGIGHSGWALGVARRALDEIQGILASGRARIGGGQMRDEQVIQRAFSQNTLALRSVRLLVHDTIGTIVERLDAGDPMTKAMQDELVSAVTYQTDVCMDVVRWAYMTSGSSGSATRASCSAASATCASGRSTSTSIPDATTRWARACWSVVHVDATSTAIVNGANMTEPHIERFGPDVSIGSLIEALDRDGVRDGLRRHRPRTAVGPQRRVRRADRGYGARHAEPHSHADRLHGSTRRFGSTACPGKSKAFVELLQHPLAARDGRPLPPAVVPPLPAEHRPADRDPARTRRSQHLHRDDTAWIHPPIPTDRDAVPTGDVPQLEVIVLYALCDFTAENGATRVVPGSHLWPARRKPQEHEVVAAEMKAGSAIYYVGKTLHGGGPNQTQDQPRRALFLGFSLGWLRTKENFFISTPIEAVREMPHECSSCSATRPTAASASSTSAARARSWDVGPPRP